MSIWLANSFCVHWDLENHWSAVEENINNGKTEREDFQWLQMNAISEHTEMNEQEGKHCWEMNSRLISSQGFFHLDRCETLSSRVVVLLLMFDKWGEHLYERSETDRSDDQHIIYIVLCLTLEMAKNADAAILLFYLFDRCQREKEREGERETNSIGIQPIEFMPCQY